MATSPKAPPLKLTRDQLASFLQDFEQVKQFENLFSIVQTIAPIVGQDFEFEAANAQATANEALSLISALSQKAAIESGSAENKAVEALSSINKIAQALQLLALAPVRNNIELSHDVTGILPYANQTARVRSNQVLTWLSM
jgi:hypothetical protein